MDDRERTVMAQIGPDGISAAQRQSRAILHVWCAFDLHAYHHFSRAQRRWDGSLKEGGACVNYIRITAQRVPYREGAAISS